MSSTTLSHVMADENIHCKPTATELGPTKPLPHTPAVVMDGITLGGMGGINIKRFIQMGKRKMQEMIKMQRC